MDDDSSKRGEGDSDVDVDAGEEVQMQTGVFNERNLLPAALPSAPPSAPPPVQRLESGECAFFRVSFVVEDPWRGMVGVRLPE